MCKSHYIHCLIKELGIDNLLGNPTYTPTTLTKEGILDNHRSVLCSELEFTSYFSMVTLCVQRISCSHGSSNCHRLKIKQIKPFPPSEKCDCLISSKRTVRYSLYSHQWNVTFYRLCTFAIHLKLLLLSLPTRSLTILFLCLNHIT
jgi:hypothetical protein